jgi:RNA polymerase sigma factor (TIGR02999 family)
MTSQIPRSDDPDITQLLSSWSGGDRDALDQVATAVYDELKRLAHDRLRGERPDHTLNTTGLVHEAYVRLVDVERVEWTDRNHFLSMASRMMRRVLVDQARRRNAAKRGGDGAVTLEDEHLLVTTEQAGTVLELDEAIRRLEEEHPRPAKALELHYFGGLTQQEVGEVLEVSQPTVARDLRFAVAWLARAWGDS